MVDDDHSVRDVVAAILRRSGYEVIAADSPEDAEARFAAMDSSVSLVVTDVVMPECSGSLLYERLSARKPQLKVLFLSGYSDGVIEQKAGGGLTPLMRKPFTPDRLAQKVREVLDG